MKVLDIYAGKEHNLSEQFPNAEVEHIIITDVDQCYGEYDVVYCSHALQSINRTQVPVVIDMMKKRTKQGGELWLFTPSLEWAAGEILKNEPNPLVQAVLFGFDNQNRTGFTLLWLRALLENAGMITRRANQGPYQVNVNDQVETLPQNIVIAMRYDTPADPGVY